MWPATARSRQLWNGQAQPNSHQNLNQREEHGVPLLSGSCQGKTHVRRQGRRNWRRHGWGCCWRYGWRCALGRRGSKEEQDTPQRWQPWVTHARAGTLLRDSSPWTTHAGQGHRWAIVAMGDLCQGRDNTKSVFWKRIVKKSWHYSITIINTTIFESVCFHINLVICVVRKKFPSLSNISWELNSTHTKERLSWLLRVYTVQYNTSVSIWLIPSGGCYLNLY